MNIKEYLFGKKTPSDSIITNNTLSKLKNNEQLTPQEFEKLDEINTVWNKALGGEELTKDEKKTILIQLEHDYVYREKQTIAKWRNAINEAENYFNRYYLHKLFIEMDLDGYIASVKRLRKSKVTGMPFIVYNNDNIDDEMQEYFEKKWFYDFIGNAMDYIFEGFILLQMILDGENIKFQKIPLSYIVPEKSVFKKDSYSLNGGINYMKDNKYSDYMIEIYENRRDLGLYTKLAPLFLWSKQAKVSWSEYTEVFGQPIKVIKTASKRPEELNRLNNMLKNMGRSLGLVINNNDTLDFIESNNTDAYQTFNEFIKLCNKEIAQLVLGASMINDDGSSYSQSQVHQLQFDSITKDDIRNMEYIINDVLIPKLTKLGLVKEGTWLKFDQTENLSIKEKFEIDKELLPYYELDTDYLMEKYNTKIIQSKNIFLDKDGNN